MTFDLEQFRADLKIFHMVKNKYTLRKLSELSKVPHQTINQIQLGTVINPSVITTYKLCGMMGVEPNKYFIK